MHSLSLVSLPRNIYGNAGHKGEVHVHKEDIRQCVVGLEEDVQVVSHELDRCLIALLHLPLQPTQTHLQVKEACVAMSLEEKPDWVEVLS